METQPWDCNLLEPLASNAEWVHEKSATVRLISSRYFFKLLIAWLNSFFSMINLAHNRGRCCWWGWMSYDEECLPALALAIQQSGHDMMPIITSLPFYDVISKTDDFLVSVTITHLYMYIHRSMYTYPCRCLFFWRSLRGENKGIRFDIYIYLLFNCY